MPPTETIVRCNQCSGLNAHGLGFCLFCGKSLVGTLDVRLVVPRPCKACSNLDALSQKFCISCGANMTILEKANQILVSSLDQSPLQLSERRQSRQNRKKKTYGLDWQSIVAAALVLSTITAAIYALSQYQMSQQTGLIVHASPIGSTLTIADKSGFVIKTGIINNKGEVQIMGLKPGNYTLSISHVGYVANSQSITIMPNKVKAIGVPQDIELISESKANESAGNELSHESKSLAQKSELSEKTNEIAKISERAPENDSSDQAAQNQSNSHADGKIGTDNAAHDPAAGLPNRHENVPQSVAEAAALAAAIAQQHAEQKAGQFVSHFDNADEAMSEHPTLAQRRAFINRRFAGHGRRMGLIPSRYQGADPTEAPPPPSPAYTGQ